MDYNYSTKDYIKGVQLRIFYSAFFVNYDAALLLFDRLFTGINIYNKIIKNDLLPLIIGDKGGR